MFVVNFPLLALRQITGPGLSLVSLSLKMEVYFRVSKEGKVHT